MRVLRVRSRVDADTQGDISFDLECDYAWETKVFGISSMTIGSSLSFSYSSSSLIIPANISPFPVQRRGGGERKIPNQKKRVCSLFVSHRLTLV